MRIWAQKQEFTLPKHFPPHLSHSYFSLLTCIMTCHIQETFWNECGHRIRELTHSHVCPLFKGADQHVSSEGPARCRNIRSRVEYEAGLCALCRARDSGENIQLPPRGPDHTLPIAFLNSCRIQFASRLIEQTSRDFFPGRSAYNLSRRTRAQPA